MSCCGMLTAGPLLEIIRAFGYGPVSVIGIPFSFEHQFLFSPYRMVIFVHHNPYFIL